MVEYFPYLFSIPENASPILKPHAVDVVSYRVVHERLDTADQAAVDAALRGAVVHRVEKLLARLQPFQLQELDDERVGLGSQRRPEGFQLLGPLRHFFFAFVRVR